jgi:hypothetical protein
MNKIIYKFFLTTDIILLINNEISILPYEFFLQSTTLFGSAV